MSERYTPLRAIASGGMGTVYLGRREGLGGFSRLVALKRAHPDLASKPSVQRRFVREANAASMLHHANVVAVVDLFTKDGDSWLVLDWVDGVSLSELLSERGQVPLRVAIHILLDACAGLSAAHELRVDDAPLGLQHRDVSPGNVLVGRDGVARIADFGLARTFDTTLTNTEDRFLEGKLGYLAPELFQGKDFDERCDLYALGVVAWEILAGMRLFRAKTLTKLVAEQKAPTRLGAIYPALAWLDPIIDRAMAFDPARRASTVREFMNELTRAAERHGALGTAAEVSRFMLGAPATGTPISELSANTPITGGLVEHTPPTGPLGRSIVEAEASSNEIASLAVAAETTRDDEPLRDDASDPVLVMSDAASDDGEEPDAPTPPPPHRSSFGSLAAVAPTELNRAESPRVVAPLVAGSFLGAGARSGAPIEDPVSLDSTLVPAPRTRAGLWLAGLVGISAISVALIAATRSEDAPAVAAPQPIVSYSAHVARSVQPRTAPTTLAPDHTAIVIGPEEAASARVRDGVAPSATAAPAAPTSPSPESKPPTVGPTATAKSLPDNPYRKKSP